MLRRAVKITALLTAVLFFVSGCWDAQSIEDRDICTAVVVDTSGQGYSIFVEIAAITSKIQNPQSEHGGQGGIQGGTQGNTVIVEGSGKDFSEAREDLGIKLNKPLYLGAVQSVVLTERMAKSGIEEYIYRIRQDNQYRKTVDMIVTPDNPNDFLNTVPANSSSVGIAIETTMQKLRDQGRVIHLSLQDVLEKLASKNACYIMPTLSQRGNQIAYTGYTVFDGGKSTGFIPFEQSYGISIIKAENVTDSRLFYTVPLDNNSVTVQVTRGGIDIKPDYDNGSIVFTIDTKCSGCIFYPANRNPITEQTEREIKDRLKEMLFCDLRETLNLSQKQFGCDYLSFSEYFRIRYPDIYDGMNWKEEFAKARFNINMVLDLESYRTLDYDVEETAE